MIVKSKKCILTLIGVLFLFVIADAQQTKLMSYNIGSSNWSITKDSVISRITTNDPDVFCAIEATGTTRPYLESSLTNYNLLKTFGGNPNVSESHIFYRKNMFSVIDSGYTQMDTYGGYSGPGRYVNWVKLEENSSQNQFLVYASHMVHVSPSNADSSTIGQYRHADGMVQLMNQHVLLNIPMITVGDFNADSSTAVMQFLQHQTPITFNSSTINNPIDMEDSWYIANPTMQKPGTVGSGLSSLAIDWILTTPNTNVISALIDDQGFNGGIPPSDHKPLQITFDLNPITSIDEISNDIKFKVYPNPFRNFIQFEIENIDSGKFNIHISDINGKYVNKITEFNLNNNYLTIDFSKLEDGIYFYNIETNHQQITGKIVKLNMW